jgi:dolichyl-phosphate beta-glucosyltransferase
MKGLHVVLPVYNEVQEIEEHFARVVSWAKDHPEFEFSFVDDGSTDGTAERLLRLAKSCPLPGIRVLALPVHRGKGYALREGFALQPGLPFCFTDGDLAYPLELLLDFHRELASYHLVIASRGAPLGAARSAPWIRSVLGWGFNTLVRLILDLAYVDTQAGLKAMRQDVALALLPRCAIDGFAFDVELLWIAHRWGLRVGEIPVATLPTHSYTRSRLRLFRDSWEMFRDLLRIAWRDRHGCYQTNCAVELRPGGV